MGRAAAVALLLALVASVVPASATFPGRNGDLLVEAAKVGPNGGPQLWLTSPDGRHARLIFTAARCASLAGAQFLPSGTQVVVQESFGCGPIEWGLVLVNTNGGGTRQFFVHSSALVTAVTPGAIAIAPDGRMLADSHVVGLRRKEPDTTPQIVGE